MKGSNSLVGISFILAKISMVCVVICCVSAVEHKARPSSVSEGQYDYNTIYNKAQAITINIDTYIDILVLVIREGLNNIDPYPLPDVIEQFDEKVWITSLSGQLRMQNGIVHNLNSLQRRGNATLKYESLKLYIETEFVFQLIIFDYSFVSEIIGLGPRGYLSGYARDLVFHSVLAYDFQTETIRLQSLDLIEKGDVKVNVMVSKLIDWLANPIINWLATLYEEKLLYMLRDVLQKIIGEHLPPKEILFRPVPMTTTAGLLATQGDSV